MAIQGYSKIQQAFFCSNHNICVEFVHFHLVPAAVCSMPLYSPHFDPGTESYMTTIE